MIPYKKSGIGSETADVKQEKQMGLQFANQVRSCRSGDEYQDTSVLQVGVMVASATRPDISHRRYETR